MGDLILDDWAWLDDLTIVVGGEPSRRVTIRQASLGGAANVAASMGQLLWPTTGQRVSYFGNLGSIRFETGRLADGLLNADDTCAWAGIVCPGEVPVKLRFVDSGGRPLAFECRIDYETTPACAYPATTWTDPQKNDERADQLVRMATNDSQFHDEQTAAPAPWSCGALVIADYGKGLLRSNTDEPIEEPAAKFLLDLALRLNAPLFVDRSIHSYRKCSEPSLVPWQNYQSPRTVFKATERELRRMLPGLPSAHTVGGLISLGRAIDDRLSRAKLARAGVVVTFGERGAIVVVEGGTAHVCGDPVEATSVVGAGDVFLAGLASHFCLHDDEDVRGGPALVRAAGFADRVARDAVRRSGTCRARPIREINTQDNSNGITDLVE